MSTIQINFDRWNQQGGDGVSRNRIMLDKWCMPCVYPNGYRWTPFVTVTKTYITNIVDVSVQP